MNWNQAEESFDVVVIGGGLSGLAAAALASRAGKSVVLLERSKHLGGRGATTLRDGVSFNMGPHALYCGGDLMRLCRELEIPFTGRAPNPGKSQFLHARRTYPQTSGIWDLIRSPLFSLREKWQLARLTKRLSALDPRTLDGVSVRAWVEKFAGTGNLGRMVHTFLRLGTFINDPDALSAGAAVEQLQLAINGGVWYLDGGWQTLANGLAVLAESQGAQIRLEAAVRRVAQTDEGLEIALGDGSVIRAKSVIVALTPEAAAEILEVPDSHPVARFIYEARPARAACLDVALRRLPRPEERFTLGLDSPVYLSVHSAAAELGPSGVAVVQVMKYVGPDKPESNEGVERELEQVLDDTQPGWRQELLTRRFLPNMIAVSAIPTVAMQGTAGRPGPAVEGRPGIFLAGDWVGSRGVLADASAASAAQAVRMALEHLSRRSSQGAAMAS